MARTITADTIYEQLRDHGFRLTAGRRALIAVLLNTPTPLTVNDIQTLLANQGVQINLTTIYRELEFLGQQQLVHEIRIGDDSVKRFEFSLGAHHHHIRCLQCNNIADVIIPDHLTTEMKKIERQTGYTVIDHALEFVGLCAECR